MAVQDLQIFIAAVLIQKESGGNLAEVLEKVAQTVARAVPAAQTGPGAYGAGTDDRMDPVAAAGGAGIRDVPGAPGGHQRLVDQSDRS